MIVKPVGRRPQVGKIVGKMLGGVAAGAIGPVVVVLLLATAAAAHPTAGDLGGRCSIDVNRDRITLNLHITNGSDQSVLNIEPGELIGSGVGDASVFIQTNPRSVRELLPGKTAVFRWKGEIFGNGFLDISARASAVWEDGDSATSGIVNCNRLTVGNPADLTPPPTNTPQVRDTFAPGPTNTPVQSVDTPTRTRRPANTLRPTRTRRPTDVPQPTRTRQPTNTRRPTRTRVPTRQGRPTRTPRAVDTPRPTRTRQQPPTLRPTRTANFGVLTPTRRSQRPTRTRVVGRPTRTSIRPRPTRTPLSVRPTRTPIRLRPTRTPRGASRQPTVPRQGQTPGAAPVGRLHADCSLRQTNDQIAITMVVQNTTTVPLSNLAASSLGLSPEGGALFFDPTGPSPRSYRDFAAGDTVVFEWGGRMTDVGAMGFSASVSATAPNGEPVITGNVDCGIGLGPNGFFDNSTFTASCGISPGDNGSIELVVNNRSGEPLSDVVPFFTGRSGEGTAQINDMRGPAPRQLRRLAGGQTQSFVYSGSILGDGRLSFTFRVEATRETGERISTSLVMCDVDLVTGGGQLPDLAVDEADLRASWIVEEQFFGQDHCAIQEGCVGAPGKRKLLKFNTTTPNHGPGNLFLGDPRHNPTFIFSECHQHFHFEDYADYRLFDMQGALVARGHKQAFCLVDLWRPPGSTGSREPNFPDCGFQGISSGWADIYDRDLDCQWIDVTGVPDGRYILEVNVNPARVIREVGYEDNVARTEVCIGIPRSQCQ